MLAHLLAVTLFSSQQAPGYAPLLFDPISLLFWLLLLAMFFGPSYNFWRLRMARLSLLAQMEKKYGMKFITLIHRQEKIGFFGIPIFRFIDIDDSEAVLRAIRATPEDMPIALILHTPGGLVLAAAQIAKALKHHKAKTVVIVPHYAMSGGTLISLAADEIWMDTNAVLGPLDPQLALEPGFNVPAPSIVKVAREKGKDASDKTLIMADVAEKAIGEVQEFIYSLVKDRLGEERARELAKTLTEGRWTHDYPIDVEKAKELGLVVKTDLPPEVYRLMDLYPQAPHNRPGIEYIPYPVIPQPRHANQRQ